MVHPFLRLEPLDAGRWTLDVTDGLSVGRGGNRFLFGGAGLAASVQAMEQASGRPAIWATAQYLAYARPGEQVVVQTSLPAVGKHITQARATISHERGEILSATAALGTRDGLSGQWVQPPPVPSWEDCAEHRHWSSDENLGARFRFRPAHGFFGDDPAGAERTDDGRLLFWIRPVEDIPVDRVLLAVVADFMSPGIRNATGRRAGGNSLDNTIRYGAMVPTTWMLCDVQIETIASGFVHGSMLIYAEGGALLACASQSMIVRVRD